jgi:GNAT superfamily N-acetyltransferase
VRVKISVRTCSSDAELQRSLEIYNEVWPNRAATAEDVAAWKQGALATVEFLGAVGDIDAGSAAVALEASRTNLVAMLITVLPEHRRSGVGSALVDAVTIWAREGGGREIETRVEADDEESLAFARRRGYREHSREDGLELTLADVEPAAPAPPDGVEIVELANRAELARGIYDVASEALPDVPGSDDWLPPPFERFVAAHLHAAAIFVALAGGEVIGYAKLTARADGRTADHGMTAVRREARNRGVATTLKRAQIAWAKEHGFERLTAANEERNAAMQHINSLLGYRLIPGRVRLRAPVR